MTAASARHGRRRSAGRTARYPPRGGARCRRAARRVRAVDRARPAEGEWGRVPAERLTVRRLRLMGGHGRCERGGRVLLSRRPCQP